MPSCAIFTCHNNQQKTFGNCTRYFPFPKNKGLAESWYLACGRQDKINFSTARICSVHFDRLSYQTVCDKLAYSHHMYRALRDDAIPTLRLPQCVRREEMEARLPRRVRRHRQEATFARGAERNQLEKRLHQHGRRNRPAPRLFQEARRNQPEARLLQEARRNELRARLREAMQQLARAKLPRQARGDHDYVRRAPERRVVVQEVIDLDDDDDEEDAGIDFEDDDEDPLPPELSWMSYDQAIAMVKGLTQQVRRIKALSEKVKDMHEREKEMNRYLRLKLDKLYEILHARNLK